MTAREQLPTETVTSESARQGEKTYEHPAFGLVTVSRWQGSTPTRLYGSDLAHRGGLTITIDQSKMRRGLSSDWHSSEKTVCEFSMSESQWARFVASVGNGGGIPVTLNHYRKGDFVMAPAIAQPELSRKELHGQEIRDEVKSAVAGLQAELKRLASLIDSGKLGKKELREMHREMEITVGNLPGNLGYAMDTFVKASDKVVEEAKTEIEAHVDGMATRLGLEQLRSMAPMVGNNSSQADRVIEG